MVNFREVKQLDGWWYVLYSAWVVGPTTALIWWLLPFVDRLPAPEEAFGPGRVWLFWMVLFGVTFLVGWVPMLVLVVGPHLFVSRLRDWVLRKR